jgi:hypothetical protein
MIQIAAGDKPEQPISWDPRQVWSLWDMVEFVLGDFSIALGLLKSEEIQIPRRETSAREEQAVATEGALPFSHLFPRPITLRDADKRLAIVVANFLRPHCVRLELLGAIDRLDRLKSDMESQYFTPSYDDYAAHIRTLTEVIEDELQKRTAYYIPIAERIFAREMESDWGPTLTKFPSARSEIEASVNCFAFSYYPASVFHSMRIAEIGMRSLARERGVAFPKHPLEWAEWENIIDQIESKAKPLWLNMGRGPERDAIKAFYIPAVAQLRALKETRNSIMHMRGDFHKTIASKAITQVRDFMNDLSAKIGEKTKHPIGKWP